ncbi:hypothetical protein ACN4EE_12560 [Geminocystis sp. CENA526]
MYILGFRKNLKVKNFTIVRDIFFHKKGGQCPPYSY